jgi:Protein of unknown function (DUF3662)/TIR domain
LVGHVFISYSRADSEYVRALVLRLVAAQIPVWIDDAIDYGEQWETVIREQLDTCAVLVPVMTPNAESSTWVRNELARARSRDKPILPILLDGEVFFSLGHVEYEDVRGGAMPRPAFVERLRRLVAHAAHAYHATTMAVAAVEFPPHTQGPPTTIPAITDDIAQRFEERLEGIVGGRFATVLRGVIDPMEILDALQWETGAHEATLPDGRTLVPNRFIVHLSPYDHSRLAPYAAPIAQALAESQAEFIGGHDWTVYGDAIVEIERGNDLDTVTLRITTEVYVSDGYGGSYYPSPHDKPAY